MWYEQLLVKAGERTLEPEGASERVAYVRLPVVAPMPFPEGYRMCQRPKRIEAQESGAEDSG